MEKGDRKPLPLRLLAFALSLLLVISILPVNLLRAEGADDTCQVSVHKSGSGTGTVRYRLDDAAPVEIQFNDGLGTFEFDPTACSQVILSFQAGSYSLIEAVETSVAGEVPVTNPGSMSVSLDVSNILASGQEAGFDVDVTFAEEESYMVKAGTLENVSLYVGAAGEAPSLLSDEGRKLYKSQLPAVVEVKKQAEFYGINSVHVNETPVDLDENNRFTLTEAMMNGEGEAVIDASAGCTYTLIIGDPSDYEVRVSCGGEDNYPTDPQTGEVELTFPAWVKVKTTNANSWVTNLQLENGGGELDYSPTDLTPGQEVILKLPQEIFQTNDAEQHLSVTLAQVYDISLADDSSQYAQVEGFVKQNGSYPATGTEITASAPLTVVSGSNVKVTVTVQEGYALESVTVDGAAPADLTNDGNTATFVLDSVTTAQTVKVTTGELYKVQLGAYDEALGTVKVVKGGSNLAALGSGSGVWLTAEELNGAELRFEPKSSGSKTVVVSDLTIGGEKELENNKTTGPVTSAKTLDAYSLTGNTLSVEVAFKQLLTLTIAAADHGAVTATCGGETYAEGQTYSVYAGDTISFTADPDDADDYIVQSVELSYTDGSASGSLSFDTDDQSKATFTVTVSKDVTVTVTFEKRASFNDISFYWGNLPASYLTPLYATNACQVYVFAPYSNSSVKLNMMINSASDTYPVFFNNATSSWPYYNNDEVSYRYTDKSAVITFLSYAQWYFSIYGYANFVTIKAPNDPDSEVQHMAIVIDRDAPTVELTEGRDGQYYSNAPSLAVTVGEPADAQVTAAISSNKLPAEAADHAFSGLSKLYYYMGAFDESKEPGSEGTTMIGVYDASSSIQNDTETFTIDAAALTDGALNTVTIVAVDRAGNKGYKTLSIGYNTKLGLTFDDVEHTVDEEDGTVYYQAYRTATILVRDTAEGFNPSGISFTGSSTAFEFIDSGWNLSGEENTYTRRIRFKDGSYQLDELRYVSNTLDESENPLSTSIPVNETFVVDTTPPEATLKIDGDDANAWNSLLTGLNFSVWKNGAVTVKATFGGDSGQIKKKEYYIHEYTSESDTSFMTLSELQAHYKDHHGDWHNYPSAGISVGAGKRFVIYLRVQKKAGFVSFISTNGIITDNKTPTAGIELPPTSYTHDGRNLYGIGDSVNVEVTISASDPEIRSGLKKVSYLVTKTYVTEEEALAGTGWTEIDLSPGSNPSYADLTATLNRVILVKKAEFNVCKVYVYLKVEDNAGNSVVKHTVFDIDNSAPVITIEPDLTDDHIVWITYTERTSHFDKTKAENGLTVKGSDGNGNPITLVKGVDYHVSWDSAVEDDLDTDVHVMKFEIVKDAIYDLTASFTDRAGNSSQSTAAGITVDTQVPEGSITVNEMGTWNKLLDTLTFGLWSSLEDVTVTGTASDSMSGLQSVSYYKSSETTAINEAGLMTLTDGDWTEISGEWGTEPVSFNVTTLAPNEKAVIYLRLVDRKGNTKYLGTDGLVIDNALTSDWITLTPSVDADGNGLYNREDTVSVAVQARDYADPAEANSGIKLVTYEISAPNGATETGTLYSYEYTRDDGENSNGGHLVIKEYGETILEQTGALPAYEDLTHDWTGTISVDKERFNSCETTITVKVTDNAGNEAVNSVTVDIDNTDPAIVIARDEEQCVKLDGADDDFYNAYTALITYTERTHHFSEADAEANLVVTATNAEGDLALIRGVDYRIAGWQHTEDPADPDQDVHIMAIEFLTDANYRIQVSYTDLAGNAAKDDETSFTLDTQAPEGTVTVAGKGTWNTLLETLTFGLWSKDSLDVTGTAKDAVCNVKNVKYFLTDETAAKDLETLLGDSVAWVEVPGTWTTEASFNVTTIDPDQKCVIYLRLMDRAGNVNIICADGVVVEKLLEKDDITLGASKASGKDAEGKPVYGIRDDVVVTVNVKDREPWSGIKLVTYEITAPDCGTEAGILYSYEYTRDEGDNANGGHLVIYENGAKILDETGVVPAYEELTHEWNGTIPVDKEQFNSCQTTVKVRVTDNAGNTAENAVTLDIDNTRPTIGVTYATEKNPRAEDNYYTAVTATVTITERDHHFDAAAATAGILVKGTDVSGKDLNVKAGTDYVISGWEKKEGGAPDDCRHVATIKFLTDANYTLNISYTDRATNEAEPDYQNAFTKDATQPEGTLKIEKLTDETWINKIIDTLTFALFSRESVEVAHTASDEISPLIYVDYFRTDRDTVYSETELAALAESSWQSVGAGKFAAGSLSVGPDARVVVYLRVIDAAGNIRYVSTNGFILDATNPTNDTVAPRVTISQPVNGIYNTDVPIRVQVSDPIVNGSYSGLKEIRYEVKNMGAVTQSGTLYTYSGTAGKQSDLLQHWENEAGVTVDKEKNNSNNVEIIVYAVDNAGNESHDSVEIKIDVTAPTISVSYDNNNGDTAFADSETDAFFNAPRTATIVITERNFDPKAVVVTVTKDGVPQTYNLTWTTNTAGGNGDGTTNTARIVFDADGDYTFAISCTDLAGNQNKDVTYNGLAPERFTIDMTKPTIQVKYDNNDQKNETYFNAPRTATVTIEEHNFEKTRVEVRLTAKYEGENITLPKVSDWTSSGDTHTATIAYQADGDYTFDIVYKDKAGNENMPVVFASGTQAGSEFTVDTTPPAVTIEGVDPKSANTAETISLTLTATDTNFDVFEPVLTKYYLKDGKPTHEAVDIAQYISPIDNGMKLEIPDLPEDGVYVLTCTVVDKAGNAFTEFTGNDGTVVQVKDLKDGEGLLIFSVNRLGSTFYADENTIELFDQYYVETVLNDVVIYEINPDVLTEHSVSMNSEELAENRDYTVTEEKDENWNRYTYKISKDLFTAEGFYDLVIVSKDAAGNTANTNRKNVRSFQADEPYRAEFVVDKTPPVVSVSGLEENGRYQTELQTVNLLPVDDGGMLGSLLVEIWNEKGELVGKLDLSGEELQNKLKDNDGKIEFSLKESSDQYYVYVTCTDSAGNETKLEFKEVTVSTSALRIFWANKPLRWGSIGGVGGAGALAFFLLLAKKRKKKEEEVVEEKKA